MIPKFINQMLSGETITVFGDGATSRDFTYITNIVRANLLAATTERGVGTTVNIAMGGSTTLNSLVSSLCELLDVCVEPVYAPARPGDVRESTADITLARVQLGNEPDVDLRTGLRRTVEWISERWSREPQSSSS